MSNSDGVIALAAGAGGGLLLWYFLRDRDKKERPAGAAPSAGTPTPAPAAPAPAPAAPAPAAPSTATPCALRLDPKSGLTADGTKVTVADAVTRCKAAGSADVTIIKDAPAATYAELMVALGKAGVPATGHRNAGGSRRTAKPRTVAEVDPADFAATVLDLAADIEPNPTADGLARGRFGERKVFLAAIRRALRHTEYARLPRAAIDELLLRAHRHGLLELARADLVSVMDPDEVRESEVANRLVGSTFHFVISERARNATTYRGFTVRAYPDGHKGAATWRRFRADPPTTWADARDRLIAAGIVDPVVAGRTHERGGWMLSVDPHDYRDDLAEPLPGGDASARNDSPPASTFTLAIYPQGDQGGRRLHYYRAERPVTWEEARDRLVAARVVDRGDYLRTRWAGGWILATDPRVFQADRAEPLPGAADGE